MNSAIEIARAFLNARRRARWSVERLQSHQRSHVDVDGCAIETSAQFDDRFAERNALGLTLEQARTAADRELAGEPSAFRGFSWGLSTGTMGQPGVFLTSERERNLWIGTVLGKFLPLRLLTGCDVALVLKRNSRLYTDVRKTRAVRLHYFEAGTPVELWADELCALSPQVLIGPPSVLEQVTGTGEFARRPFRPQLLLAGAEPLFPQDHATLQSAYGVAPRVIYQAREGFLAAGCAGGGIHLNEDLICFERLSLGRGRFVPVITDFTRTSQRYRRYRLDDVLIGSDAGCECGQPFASVAAVEGRANDVLLLKDGPLFPLEVNELVLTHLDRPREYRITQVAADRIAIAVEGGTPMALREALAMRAEVSVEEYAASALGEKRRRIRRLFDVHNAWLNRDTVARNAARGS